MEQEERRREIFSCNTTDRQTDSLLFHIISCEGGTKEWVLSASVLISHTKIL